MTPAQLTDLVEHEKVKYDRFEGHLVKAQIERNSVGGQFCVEDISIKEAARLVADGMQSWYLCHANGGRPVGGAESLKKLIDNRTRYERGRWCAYSAQSEHDVITIQVWGNDESIQSAWKCMPFNIGPHFRYKTCRERKYERKHFKYCTYGNRPHINIRDIRFRLTFARCPHVNLFIHGFSAYP